MQKILFWITEWRKVLYRIHITLLDTISDGFVVYGDIIGGISGRLSVLLYQKTDFWKYFDLVMPSVALAQGFGSDWMSVGRLLLWP